MNTRLIPMAWISALVTEYPWAIHFFLQCLLWVRSWLHFQCAQGSADCASCTGIIPRASSFMFRSVIDYITYMVTLSVTPNDPLISHQQNKGVLPKLCSASIFILKVKFQMHCIFSKIFIEFIGMTLINKFMSVLSI